MVFSMHEIHWVGFVAGTLTTASFIPQIVKIFRSRQTRNISSTMYALSAVGVGLWIYYGFRIDSPPLVISNIVNLFLIVTILGMKLYWK